MASIGASSGLLSGLSAGTSLISYTLSGGCASSVVAVVSAAPTAGTITGLSNVCTGASITLSDVVTGGAWSSGSGGVATIGASSGIVTGISAGTTVITYTVSFSCGTASTTKIITVSLPPNAGAITGPSVVCTGASILLTDAATTGVWSATNGNATISGTGVVLGVTAGSDTINYTVTNSCSSAIASTVITINHCTLVINTNEHLQNEWSIYPNPAKTELTITAPNNIGNVTITNLIGQKVYTHECNAEKVQVDVSGFAAGVYFIKINGAEVRKFVKQ